jgi:hypothetical protein
MRVPIPTCAGTRPAAQTFPPTPAASATGVRVLEPLGLSQRRAAVVVESPLGAASQRCSGLGLSGVQLRTQSQCVHPSPPARAQGPRLKRSRRRRQPRPRGCESGSRWVYPSAARRSPAIPRSPSAHNVAAVGAFRCSTSHPIAMRAPIPTCAGTRPAAQTFPPMSFSAFRSMRETGIFGAPCRRVSHPLLEVGLRKRRRLRLAVQRIAATPCGNVTCASHRGIVARASIHSDRQRSPAA